MDYYYDWVKDLEAPDDPEEFENEENFEDEENVEYETLDEIVGPPQGYVVQEYYVGGGGRMGMNIYGFENEDQYWEASWFAGEEDGI